MKILLVEDHPGMRQNLQRFIGKRGQEGTAVGSAEEAEAALAEEKFPFLILDWMLPGKSGVDLCRELRAGPNGDEMFILLVTAKADTEDLEQALEAGSNDYLTKPLDLGLLNVRISVAERQIRELAERNQARAALIDSARTMTNILEKTTDGFFAVDSEWKLTYINAEAETMVGAKRDEVLGGVLWERFPALIGSIFQTNYERVMAEQIAIEFEAVDATGKIWYDVHAYPSNGGVSVFSLDVSERKKSETERLTTSKLESLGTLAGGIAHDLNNILTVISGNIGLAQLEAPVDSGSLLGFLSKAGQAAQHAAHLSSQLLTFSKGGAPLKKMVSIGELLEHSAEFALYGSNLRTDFDITVDLWKAEVDAGQIEQVVNALMLNAREAMPQGGTIRVRARNGVFEANVKQPLPPGRFFTVTITHPGTGITEDLRTRIFDPYFTTKPTATGLGLAISYSIVKKHGGLLLLENTSGEGSVFSFYLRATDNANGARAGRGAGRPFHYNHQRILIMDDEEAIRELTSQLLGTLGYEVTAVADGLETGRIFKSAPRKGGNFQTGILDAPGRGGNGGGGAIERARLLGPQMK